MTIDFSELSTGEKILQLQDLWDEIRREPSRVEVSQAWKQELRVRRAATLKNPASTLSDEDVQARFASR